MAAQNGQMVSENATQKANIGRLIAAMAANNPPAGGPGAPNVAQLRAEKLSKLSLALCKSGKLKDFKDSQDSNVHGWLKPFDQEILQLKKMSDIIDDLCYSNSVLINLRRHLK